LEVPEIVASNTERFIGRTWLLQFILDWPNKSDQRFFILQGRPGTGKSSILAWLAGMGPLPTGDDTNAIAKLKKIRSRLKAAHFFMSNTGNTAPKAFAEGIAKQLAQNLDKFDDALVASLAERVHIIANQKVGKARRVMVFTLANLI
jgi:ABC-type transport system involved in cytochrome c biogenesis ATPase subunit